jgi:phenylpyruvate tautomerase PptA (4-oxalocrotonate tautomerase family)
LTFQAAEPRTEKIVSASCQYQWESRKNCDATPLTENWQLTLTTAYVVLMPYLSIHTNSAMPEQAQSALLDAASKIVSSQLGKPEGSVMASFVPAARMRFAGEESPTAFLELSSIGIPDSKRNPLVAALTELVARSCRIKTDRIFVVLADVKAPFWSSNGATIG